MALLNCGKVIVLPTSQEENVLKGHHTKHLLHFKVEEGLCVGNPILLTKIENGMATSIFLILFRCLDITLWIYVGNFATIPTELFSLTHAAIGVLKFRVDPCVSVVLGFPSDVVFKNISKSLQKSFVSNHSSWIFSRQNGKSCYELPPPAFY